MVEIDSNRFWNFQGGLEQDGWCNYRQDKTNSFFLYLAIPAQIDLMLLVITIRLETYG
jgi:hypothetical protein